MSDLPTEARGDRPGDPAAAATGEPDRLISVLERAGHVLRVMLRERARAEGLSDLQGQILLRLAESADDREVRSLAAWFDVRPPTVSDSLATLVSKGLVRPVPDPNDRRLRLFQLTRRGDAVARRLSTWDDPVRSAITELGDADGRGGESSEASGRIIETAGLITELIGALQRNGAVSVARTCTGCRYFRPEQHHDHRAPHHCALLDIPLGPADLRWDCPEYEPVG